MEKELSARFELKELGEDGTFSGYASIFGSADQGKDVVHRGAFSKTLKDWEAKGMPIPVCNQHDFKSVPIGGIEEAYEDARGLFVKGKLLLDIEAARDVYHAMKNRLLSGLSFGFDAVKKEIKSGFRHLYELRLFEVSPVLFGLHPEAQVLAVKADEETMATVASQEPDATKADAEPDATKADDKPKGDYGTHSEAGYADPGLQDDKKPRYPLKEGGELSEERVRAAWNYISKPANAAKYSAEDLKAIKSKIIAAWKAKIDKDGPPSGEHQKSFGRIEFKVAQRQKASRAKRLSDAADAKSDAIDDKDEPTAEDHAAAARAHASATTAAYKVGDTSKADHHSMMARRHARAAKKAGGSKGYASEFETAQALDAAVESKATLLDVMDRRDDAEDADELCELCGYLDSALEEAINETLADFTMSPEEKLADIGEALDEFKDEVLMWAKQAIPNDGARWGGNGGPVNEVPAMAKSEQQLAEHLAKTIEAEPDKTVAVTIKAAGAAPAADEAFEVPEDFLVSVELLKALVKGA